MTQQDEYTDFREMAHREKVRAEVLAEIAQDEKTAMERDRAKRALVITTVVAGTLALPLVAVLVGVSWRLLRWAGGF